MLCRSIVCHPSSATTAAEQRCTTNNKNPHLPLPSVLGMLSLVVLTQSFPSLSIHHHLSAPARSLIRWKRCSGTMRAERVPHEVSETATAAELLQEAYAVREGGAGLGPRGGRCCAVHGDNRRCQRRGGVGRQLGGALGQHRVATATSTAARSTASTGCSSASATRWRTA